MKRRTYSGWICKGLVFTGVIILSLSGCIGMGKYGKLSIVSKGTAVKIQDFIDHWQDYDVYYAGLSYKSPSAVLFDLKEDGKRIMPDKWTHVTEKKALEEIVHWLDANIDFPPSLYRILGPDNRMFGYLYSYYNAVYVKAVDPDTLWIQNLPLPPIEYSDSFRD